MSYTSIKAISRDVETSEVIRKSRFVKFKEVNNETFVEECDANTDRVAGVSGEASTNTQNDAIAVQEITGDVVIEVGGALSPGDLVMSDTQGRAVERTGTNPVAGQVSGDSTTTAGQFTTISPAYV